MPLDKIYPLGTGAIYIASGNLVIATVCSRDGAREQTVQLDPPPGDGLLVANAVSVVIAVELSVELGQRRPLVIMGGTLALAALMQVRQDVPGLGPVWSERWRIARGQITQMRTLYTGTTTASPFRIAAQRRAEQLAGLAAAS